VYFDYTMARSDACHTPLSHARFPLRYLLLTFATEQFSPSSPPSTPDTLSLEETWILTQDEPEGAKVGMLGLIISMDDSEAVSLEQMRAFLAGAGDLRFAGQRRTEVYAFVEKTLVGHEYAGLRRGDKGLVRQYLSRLTGLGRAQVTRLIADTGTRATCSR
jgi:hypothetical protein